MTEEKYYTVKTICEHSLSGCKRNKIKKSKERKRDGDKEEDEQKRMRKINEDHGEVK